MPAPIDPKIEAEVFRQNAMEGARAVGVFWVTRRVVLPLLSAFAAVILAAFVVNGPVAGFISLVLLGGLSLLVFGTWKGQLQKVRAYWSG